MEVSKLANDIWEGIESSVKGALTPADQVVLRIAGEHVASFYIAKLTNDATEGDHKAVKAILANIKNTLGVLAADALKTSLNKILLRTSALVMAL